MSSGALGGVRVPEAEVTESCEPPNVATRTKLWSFAHSLNCRARSVTSAILVKILVVSFNKLSLENCQSKLKFQSTHRNCEVNNEGIFPPVILIGTLVLHLLNQSH